MKDTEMHKHLVEPELRDYFSNALSEIFQAEMDNNSMLGKRREELAKLGWRGKRDTLALRQAEFNYAEAQLELCKKEIAIETLLAERGWKWHDVSDLVENTTGRILGRPFIGKDKDYEEFQAYCTEG